MTAPSIRRIQDVVAGVYRISRIEMIGKRQSRDLVRPRHVAIHLCCTLTTLTMRVIAEAFRRDHTSIIHANTVVCGQMQRDRALREMVEFCIKAVGDPALLRAADEAGAMVKDVTATLRIQLLSEAVRDPHGLIERLQALTQQEDAPCG